MFCWGPPTPETAPFYRPLFASQPDVARLVCPAIIMPWSCASTVVTTLVCTLLVQLVLVAAAVGTSVEHVPVRGVDPQALKWVWENLQAQINFTVHPVANQTIVSSRDLPNAALAVLIVADASPVTSPGSKTKLTPKSEACVTAVDLLHRFGDR